MILLTVLDKIFMVLAGGLGAAAILGLAIIYTLLVKRERTVKRPKKRGTARGPD